MQHQTSTITKLGTIPGARLAPAKKVRIIIKPAAVPDTRLTEAAQCVYLAAAQFARKDVDSEYVKSHIVRTASRVAVDMPTTDIVDKLNPKWQRSSEKIANYLRTYLKRTDYVFHRNSAVVKSIYAKFAELNKAEGKPFAQSDKWNPADIWAIAGVVNVSRLTSIDQLNRYLRNSIEKGLIIPISLKQTTGPSKVKATPVNVTAADNSTGLVDLPKFKQLRVNTGKTDWTTSKQVNVEFILEKGRLGHFEFRLSKAGAALNGEMIIRSSAARHGKINIKNVEQTIREAGGTLKLPDHREIAQLSMDFDEELMRATFDLASSLDNTSTVTFDKFKGNLLQKRDLSWLASKYQALLVAQSISKLSDQKKNQVIVQLYSHALVAGELAGPFIKVE